MKGRKEIDRLGNAVGDLISIPKYHDLASSFIKAGIRVGYFVDKRYDAYLTWDSDIDCPLIALNADQSSTRMNFSMAHELGHLLLNYNWIPYGNNENVHTHKILNVKYRGGRYSVKERKEETIVNEFAAAFLVPDSEIKKILKNSENKDYDKIVEQVSNEFKVSEEMADIRLTNFLSSVD